MTKNKIESASRKRCKKFETKIEKKFKLEPVRKPELNLPNEILLKIVNYLNTKDVITNFALVCKNFKCLAKEVKYFELKDITELEFESAMEVLENTTHLKEISLSIKSKKNNLMNELLIQALKSSKRIKSIKLWPTRYLGDSDWANYKLDNVKEIKKYCKDLEHLTLIDVEIGSSLITQITKFSTLKSLNVSIQSNVNDGKFTSNHILAFANNCPNLEAISFYIKIGYNNIKHMKAALDTFFDARKQTLKSFALSTIRSSRKDYWDMDGSCLLENLFLCHNLEALLIRWLNLQSSTLEAISTSFPKIRTLVLDRVKSISQTEIEPSITSTLKHLVLKSSDIDFNLFTSMKFPVLERLAVISSGNLKSSRIHFSQMYKLIDNATRMKSIQLHGNDFQRDEEYKTMSLQFCKERDIFLSFGTYSNNDLDRISCAFTEENIKFQNDFEKNLEPIYKSKYGDLKNKFITWDDINKWWTWAMEHV